MQDFLNKAGQIAKNTASLAADKTEEVVEAAKTKARISTAKSEISDCQKKIGEYYFDLHLSGEKVDDGIIHFCEEITKQMNLIDELEEKLKKE